MATRLQRLRDRAGEETGICEACGRHVPRSLLVECDVEGLRGKDLCHYCEGNRRFEPSYLDLKVDDPIVEIPEPDDESPRGGEIYWR